MALPLTFCDGLLAGFDASGDCSWLCCQLLLLLSSARPHVPSGSAAEERRELPLLLLTGPAASSPHTAATALPDCCSERCCCCCCCDRERMPVDSMLVLLFCRLICRRCSRSEGGGDSSLQSLVLKPCCWLGAPGAALPAMTLALALRGLRMGEAAFASSAAVAPERCWLRGGVPCTLQEQRWHYTHVQLAPVLGQEYQIHLLV